MEAVREQEVRPSTQEKKKSFMNRMRRSSKKEVTKEKESRAPSSSASPHMQSVTRDGVPVVSSSAKNKFKPSDVRQSQKSVKNGHKWVKESVILEKAPAARESAFSGPPRYDWIDIETAAAIKVQSVFRRNQVMDDMADQGMETTAMRNRRRRRKAKTRKRAIVSEDAPSMFQCCGAGLMFGDATEEDEDAQRAFEKEEWQTKKRDNAQKEAKLRAYKPRAKADQNMRESIEIVE